jgi:dCMP deaminase
MDMKKARKFLTVAQSIAALSKDRSTQVGALILGPDGEGGPWGYNGFPRGADDDVEARHERPEKYFWAEHAERNAIYAAAAAGFRTKGCTLVVTHPPCMDCARAIVQAGIVRVVYPTGDAEFHSRWGAHEARTRQLFAETSVEVVEIDAGAPG